MLDTKGLTGGLGASGSLGPIGSMLACYTGHQGSDRTQKPIGLKGSLEATGSVVVMG